MDIDFIQEIQKKGFKKILILGCPGCGKSTFADKIGFILNLPVFKMDDLYWKTNWNRPLEPEFLTDLMELLTQPKWIIEGNYYRYIPIRLHYADAVIYLDVNPVICLLRVTKRFFHRLKGEKASLPIAITRNLKYKFRPSIALKLIINILTFSKKTKPAIFKLIHKLKKPYFYITNLRY